MRGLDRKVGSKHLRAHGTGDDLIAMLCGDEALMIRPALLQGDMFLDARAAFVVSLAGSQC